MTIEANIKLCIYDTAAMTWRLSVEALGDIPISTARGKAYLPDDMMFDILGYIKYISKLILF